MSPDLDQLQALHKFCDVEQIRVTSDKLSLLVEYVEKLHHWQKAFRLCGYRDKDSMMKYLVMESLLLLPYIQGSLLDVGTGAGIPGLILAIANPNLPVVLIESNGKKFAFLQQIKFDLEVANVEIVNQRVETYCPAQKFSVIISRAFRSLREMIKLCQHLCGAETKIMALKGPKSDAELAEIPDNYELVARYPLPFEGKRHELVCVQLSSKGRINFG